MYARDLAFHSKTDESVPSGIAYKLCDGLLSWRARYVRLVIAALMEAMPPVRDARITATENTAVSLVFGSCMSLQY